MYLIIRLCIYARISDDFKFKFIFELNALGTGSCGKLVMDSIHVAGDCGHSNSTVVCLVYQVIYHSEPSSLAKLQYRFAGYGLRLARDGMLCHWPRPSLYQVDFSCSLFW